MFSRRDSSTDTLLRNEAPVTSPHAKHLTRAGATVADEADTTESFYAFARNLPYFVHLHSSCPAALHRRLNVCFYGKRWLGPADPPVEKCIPRHHEGRSQQGLPHCLCSRFPGGLKTTAKESQLRQIELFPCCRT